jgi:hypothetical protein
VAIAEKIAPYRHARLTAVKLAGDANNLVRMIRDDATADELRAEIMKHVGRLVNAGIIDLKAFLGPGVVDQPSINGVDRLSIRGN